MSPVGERTAANQVDCGNFTGRLSKVASPISMSRNVNSIL